MFKIGVNAILIQDSKVLLGKRLSSAGSGTWGVPGGHLEPGEHLVDAVKRELLEETGLVATELTFLQLINDPRQGEHYLQINFLVKSWSGKLELKEPDKCSEWKWFDLKNLPEDIFFGHKEFLPAYFKNINFIS